MIILPIPAFSDNYIWTISDRKKGIFECIDPGDAKPILHFAKQNQLDLRTILLTHHHQDHIAGVDELIRVYPACIVYGPYDMRIPWINIRLQKQQRISVGQYRFQILFNPGHTSTHISYYETQQGWLFCGDTLFSAGCGRVFDATVEELHQSLQRFKSLPYTTQIFPAHEYTRQNLLFAQMVEPNNLNIETYLKELQVQGQSCTLPSTLGHELLINPFLRTDKPEVQKYALRHGALSKNSLEVFKVLREEKNKLK